MNEQKPTEEFKFSDYKIPRVSPSLERFAERCPEYHRAERERERLERERRNLKWLRRFYREADDDLRREYYEANRDRIYFEIGHTSEAMMDAHRGASEEIREIIREMDPHVIDFDEELTIRPLSELRGQDAHKVQCVFRIEKCNTCKRWEARKKEDADSKADA